MLARLAICLATALALAGCATTKPSSKSAYQTYVDTYTVAASNPPKILDLECPATGCNFTKLVVYNPAGVSNSLQPPPVEPNIGLEIFREVKSTLLGVMPWYAGMRVLEKSYEVANHSVTTNTAIDNSNRSTSSTSNTSIANTTTTSTSTTTNTTNSNNVSHQCSTGGSTGGSTGAGGTTGSTNC